MRVCDFCGKEPTEDLHTNRVSCTNPECEMVGIPFWYDDWQERPKEWKVKWKDWRK